MNGEQESRAHTDKVSEQTLHSLEELLNRCNWVEKVGYDEIAEADRTKLRPLIQTLLREVNLPPSEYYFVRPKCPQTITPRDSDTLIPIRLNDQNSTLSQRRLVPGQLIGIVREEGDKFFTGDAVLLCLLKPKPKPVPNTT